MITGLIIGFVAGAVVMYLFARNSPNHFMKYGAYVDAAYQKAKSVNSK